MKPYALKQSGITTALLIIASTIFSQSSINLQKDLPHTLLWRISGNGLKQSSYLFGTMHLSDKRMFNFDDSVYKAIERSEGMAMEVNPEEMIAYAINQTMNEMNNAKMLKTVLSPKDFDKYKDGLSKKFNKPADRITVADITKEKNRWLTNYMLKGEMPTFVDTYLYNIARKQGKWVGGIEDIVDQAGLLQHNIDNTDIKYILASEQADKVNISSIENMIHLYESQDLSGLFSIITQDENDDYLLNKRNIKMARRMDSLSALRTMFFAVGAAHLPGDSGVIKMLRDKGFSVDPVISQKKIQPQDYKIPEIEIPWVTFTEKGFYSASMPGNPVPIKLYGLVNMKFYFDIFNMSGCYTMALKISGQFKNKDSLMDAMTDRIFPSKVKTKIHVSENGINGNEYAGAFDNFHVRLRLYVENGNIYVAMYMAMKETVLKEPAASKFFSSIKIDNNPETVQAQSYVFTDSISGFQFISPSVLEKNASISSDLETMKITGYSGQDLNTGAFVMFFIKTTTAGYTLAVDSLVNQELFAKFAAKHYNIRKASTIDSGIVRYEFGARQKENPAFYTRAISILKNNRNFILTMVGDSAQLYSTGMNTYFTSGRFLILPYTIWNWQTTPDSAVAAYVPAEFHLAPQGFTNKNQYISHDSISSLSYILAVDTLSRYTWYKNDSVFFDAMSDPFMEAGKKVYSHKINNGKIKGREVLVKLDNAANRYKRIRILLNNNVLLRMIVEGQIEMLESTNCDSLFTSLRILKENPGIFITTPKLKEVLTDLSSSDVNTRTAANLAMRAAPLETSDLSALFDAFNQSFYSTYDSSVSNYFNYCLAEKIGEIADSMRKTGVLSEQWTDRLIVMSKRISMLMMRNDTTENSYVLYSFVTLLTELNTAQTTTALLEMAKNNAGLLNRHIAMELIKHQQKVPPQLLEKLASDTSLRGSLYQDLKDAKTLNLFPKRYLNRTSMSEAMVYDLVSYEDDQIVQKLNFLKTEEVIFRKKKYIIYLYRVKVEDENYLAIIGGFEPLKSDVTPLIDFSGIYWKENYMAGKTEQFVKKYLKGFSEDK